ncbi:MAG: lamin tail domain-containing protein, partial [Candidatus Marinimicrobia bacterium]|nr:lamin tail domain-containing protein [Candidatus Neomarinimicrobiota bacterium]
MKNYTILFIFLITAVFSQDLFFSEYIEGSSYNKALEIYNPTDSPVDLSQYQLWQISNGGDWPEYTVDISGTLNPGDVFVVCHEDADDAMTSVADLLITLYHNGDDAQGLAKNDGTGNFALIDAIGESGEDPGSGWDVAGVSDGTKEHTLVRMPNVSQGNTDWGSSAGTNSSNSEWLVYSQNTFDYLGSHDYGGTVLIAEAGEDQFASPGDAVVLDGSGSVGDIIAYIWEQVSGTSVTINGGDNVVATFTAPADGGTLEFQLTVYDSDGNSEMDGTTVNVVSQVSIAEARSMGVGEGVMVEGVVIAPNFQEGNGNTEYVIQDETGGLVIFGGGFDAELNYGELVQVTGLTD